MLPAKGWVATLKSVSILRLGLSAAILTTKMVLTVRWWLISINKTPAFSADSPIVPHYSHDVKSHFGISIASRPAASHEGIEVNEWRDVKSADDPAELCCRGSANLKPSKTRTNLPKSLSTSERLWPVSDINNRHEPATDVKGSIMTAVSSLPMSFLSKFTRYSSWINLLKAGTKLKWQILVMKVVRPLGRMLIRARTPNELRLAERDLIRTKQSDGIRVNPWGNDCRAPTAMIENLSG